MVHHPYCLIPAVLVEATAVIWCLDASAHSVPLMMVNFEFRVERIHLSHVVLNEET